MGDLPKVALANSLVTMEKLNNKWEFYLICRDLGLSVPMSIKCNDVDALKRSKLNYPIISKPLNHGNGFGIKIINRKEEIDADIFKLNKFKFPSVIIQEFISGSDLQVLFVAKNGELITQSLCFQYLDGVRVFVHNKKLLENLKLF